MPTQYWGTANPWGGVQTWGGTVGTEPVTVTDDDLLDLVALGRIDWTWEFTLYDRDGDVIGPLHPDLTAGTPSLRWDTSRTTMRTLSGLTLLASDAAGIRPLSDVVGVTMVLQNGSRYPVGRFVFAQVQTQRATAGQPVAYDLLDRAVLLDQPTGRTVALWPSQIVDDLYHRLAHEVLGPDAVMVMASPEVRPAEPLVWPAGTSRYEILADLADMMGCYPPHFDGTGRLVCRPVRVDDDAYDHAYDATSNVIAGSVVEVDASMDAPNRFIVTGGTGVNTVAGRWDVPADAPHSIAQRGYVVAVTRSLNGVETAARARRAARAWARRYTANYRTVSFSTLPDPRHGEFDTVAWYGKPHIETGWEISLAPGGLMTHDLARYWVEPEGTA